MLLSNAFRLLRNPEFIQQGKDLATLILGANPTSLFIQKQYDVFNNSILALDDTFKLSQKSELTQVLINLDEKRDDIFIGMCFIIDGYAKSWLPNIKAQALQLKESIDVYGRDITVANYQSESASISSLIDKWENTPALADALTALHIDDWKAALKATNTLFTTTYTNRATDDGAKSMLPKMKVLRNNTMVAWNKLQKVLIGKIEEYEDDATKAPLYAALESSINGVLNNYNLLITHRQAKKTTPAANVSKP